jgi:hypothetical protein
MSTYRYLLLFALLLFLASCVSAEKYNLKRLQPISVKKLQKDIDFVQRNLYKRHPDFDLYTPKSELDLKFDSLRKAITAPLNSTEFYPQIASVIASVHQGHMAVLPAARRVSRERKRFLKKMGPAPLSQFDYAWEQGKLYILRNKSKDSLIKPGTEVIAVNGIEVSKLYDKYALALTADGYNQSALPYFFAKRIAVFYTEELGVLDSAFFSLRRADSAYERLVVRMPKGQKNEDVVKSLSKDSNVVNFPPQAVNRSSSETAAAEKDTAQSALVPKYRFGYDEEKNKYTKELFFYGEDSSLAYFNLKEFTHGSYRKPYKTAFNYIREAASQVLVVDLRGNPGGRVAEVVELYRYFADTSFQMYAPSKVASKTSLLRAGIYRKVPKPLWPVLSLYYPVYAANRFFKTTKGKDGYYYYKGMSGHKVKKPQEAAFKGKIYLLVNPESFSAACLLASRMRVLPNVTIVGEETGGDFNGTVAGILPIMKLPHSKIIWRMGLMHIQPVNRVGQKGRGIMPDKAVVPKIGDRIAKKDIALDWIFEQEHIQP